MDHGVLLTDTERRDRLRLARTAHVGPVTFRQLMARFGTAADALDALPELARRGGARAALAPCPVARAERELDALTRADGRLIALGEADYPRALAAIPDAPPVLSVLGEAGLLARPMVAVVGARNASANGLRFAEMLARDLGAAGPVVVSGLARGLDAAAHRGALATGTVAVLAGGVDVVYPRENTALYTDILAHGGALSEQPWGLQPTARHFPFRNRIVSGLALAVVVVEATLRSGSLITARLAGEQGREVLAVPGNPLDARARGTNGLIRDGATLVQGADDVLEALAGVLGYAGGGHAAGVHEAGPGPAPYLGSGAPDERYDSSGDEVSDTLPAGMREKIIELLGATPVSLDEVLRRSGLAAAEVSIILLELELAGRVARHPGGQVSLAFGG